MQTLAEVFAGFKALSAKVDAFLAAKPAPADAASELPALKAQLATLEGSLTAFGQMESDLATAKQTIGTLTTQKAAAEAQVTDLAGKVNALEAEKKAAEGNWQDPKFKESAGAAQLAAAQGVTAALPIPTQSDAAGADKAKTIEGLTGLARVTAAFAAQKSK